MTVDFKTKDTADTNLFNLTILDDPNVEVQIKADRFKAKARSAESPEREQLWDEAVKTWPNYNIYQSRTERRIPVVVIERA